MFENDEIQELFSDGYREPGDDGVRFAFYILLGVGFCGSVAIVFGEIATLVATRKGLANRPGLDVAMAISCAVIAGVAGYLFVKESKRWDLRKISADKVVAGGFLTGIAILYLGLRMGFGGHSGGVHANMLERVFIALGGAGLGAAICLLSLLVGLVYAFGEKIQERPRKLKEILIDRRYAIDSNLCQHDNHPCPWEDGMTAVVLCRTPDGKKLRLVAKANAYDLADPGKVGAAVMRGSKLQEFHPKR